MSSSRYQKYTMEQVLAAIKDSHGIITTIAKRLGCSWSKGRDSIDRWETTRKAFEDEIEQILDLAESKLFTSINNGDVQSAKWILSTKGKKRGYTERQEVTGPDGDALRITYRVVKPDGSDGQG